jgi:hypothetical protein
MAADGDEVAARTGQKRMAEAMDEVDEALQRYIHAERYGSVEQARERLHGAVMTLYSRMQPHLQDHGEAWQEVADCDVIGGEAIYTGVHPRTGREVTVSGFRDLATWRNRVVSVSTESTGSLSRGGSVSQEIVVRLPGEALITVAQLLRHYYVEFGWDVDRDEQQHDYKFEYADVLQEGPPEGDVFWDEHDNGQNDSGGETV